MEAQPNPLLTKIKIPGRTFQLPSRGALYTNGEISSQEGELHVHPLSALAEISLKNPDLLFNGKAIESVFAECIPEIKKPQELYGRDIDAIMVFLRLVTYGPQYVVNAKHTCENAKEHSYTVDIEKMIQEMKQLDATTVDKIFTTVLPNGQVVKVHPVKFEHMIRLFQMNLNKEEYSEDDINRNTVFNLVNVIESVDGINDKKLIEEWVRAISTPFQNRITEVIERSNDWGPNTTTTLKCKDCGEDMLIQLPLDPISFFTE